MTIDLHCHTTASDGALAPSVLLERALANGVTQLAITDHDTLAGYDLLGSQDKLTLIPGIELSTRWRKIGVHIVGLNVDPANPVLRQGIERQLEAREKRARKIANRLTKLGIDDPLPAVREIANNGNIGRPHFAQHLVDIGLVKDQRQAFRKYLGAGKAGDIRESWADFEDVIGWINHADGIAVLAHPAHYNLTMTKLRELLRDFTAAGGRAIEVVSGRQEPQVGRRMAGLADEFDLLASVGSDFHKPGLAWAELGRCAALPDGCRPVWKAWQ